MSPLTVEEISKRLHMSSSDVSAFKSGKVVTEERDSSNDKDLCLLVALTVPAGIDKTWEFAEKERMIEVQDAVHSQGLINLSTFHLEGVKLDHGAAGNIGKYAMSKAEGKKVHHAKHKEEAFKEMLQARAKSYWQHGLKGIEPYEGKRHDIADDITSANKAALSVLDDKVLREEITVVPSKSKHPEMHSLAWQLTEGNEMTSFILCHRIHYKKQGEGFFVLVRKFYSACDFDASQICVGVLPTSDGHSAIFYVNHTYTAAVAGFGGGVKRSVGRKMMKEKLQATMEKAQKAFK